MPCNLCGSQETLQRQAIKQMLHEWERKHPGRIENTFRALTAVAPSQLADASLFDFAVLGRRTAGDRPNQADWLLGPAAEPDPGPAA